MSVMCAKRRIEIQICKHLKHTPQIQCHKWSPATNPFKLLNVTSKFRDPMILACNWLIIWIDVTPNTDVNWFSSSWHVTV
jgi:hypothetical protein